MGPTVEQILVASILLSKFDIDNIDWANITQEELDCTQLNGCANFLQSICCEDIHDAIFKMKEIYHDAHLIWVTLKDIYDEAKCDVQIQEVSKSAEDCTASSETEPQMTASKIQEGKYSIDRDLTFDVAVYPKVPDMEPGSSGSGRETERHRPSEESTSTSHSGSHLDHHQCFMAIHENKLDSDNDSDDEELVDKLRKMSNKSQTTIIEIVKMVMKQD
jgi:hypothetical protein